MTHTVQSSYPDAIALVTALALGEAKAAQEIARDADYPGLLCATANLAVQGFAAVAALNGEPMEAVLSRVGLELAQS